jgi:hypothetical protein
LHKIVASYPSTALYLTAIPVTHFKLVTLTVYPDFDLIIVTNRVVDKNNRGAVYVALDASVNPL